MDALDLIAKIKMDLSEYDKGLDEAKEKAETGGSAIGNAFGKLASGGFKVLTASIATAAAGVTALTTAAVHSYAEYEQLEGGVKKLYGNMGMSLEEYAKSVGKSTDEVRDKYNQLEKAQNLVLENAKKAYETSGMSMNKYMETATSFSAKLINDLGGDTVKAAELTDKAMQAISDNFNTFGGDIGMIQGAFQGFAKGNYMMLDNLKLGYGGTKTEMERLIADANEYAESIGKASDLTIDSFADQIEAIQLIQEKQQIAGTTQREAATTIEGALNMTKAAWENLLTAMGNKEEDLSGYINTLVDSVSTLGKNLMPVIEQALTGVAQLIEELAPVLVERIPNLINEVLPQILEAGVNIVNSLIDGISKNIDKITTGLSNILVMLVNSIVSMLPQFIEIGVKLLVSLADGISQALPTLIPTIVDVILNIGQTLIEHLPELVDTGLQIAMALLDGIIEAIPQIIEALPDLIDAIIETLTESSDAIMQGALEMFMAIVDALPDILDALIDALPQIIDSITNFLTGDGLPKILAGAVDMFMGIINAIPQIIVTLGEKLPLILAEIIAGIGTWVSDLFDKAVEVFGAIVDGFVEGIAGIWDWITDLPSKIMNKLMEVWSELVNIGAKIIEGIKEGIFKGGIEDAIRSKVRKMVDAAKEEADIHSPSRVFRDEVGKMMAKGLGVGWSDEMDKVNEEIRKDLDFGEASLDLSVNKSFNTMPIEAQTTMKLSDADIDKIVKGLSITLYNTTEIDSVPIKREVYKYTVDRMDGETKALQMAQGGAF